MDACKTEVFKLLLIAQLRRKSTFFVLFSGRLDASLLGGAAFHSLEKGLHIFFMEMEEKRTFHLIKQ
jgi:hypothetical protein